VPPLNVQPATFQSDITNNENFFVCINNWLYFCFSTMKYQIFRFQFILEMFSLQNYFWKGTALNVFPGWVECFFNFFYLLDPDVQRSFPQLFKLTYLITHTRNHAILFVVVMTIIIHSMGFPETIGYEHICVGKWFIFSPSLVRRMACVSL